MREILKIIFGITGTILFLLNFLFCYLYFTNYYKKNDPYDLKDKLDDYMKEHKLNKKDYNFDKVFWISDEDPPILVQLIFRFIFIIINVVYIITGIIGFIFYLVGLPKQHVCLFITVCILFSYQIVISIVDICVAFMHSTLTEKDLSDFGELNSLIKETYDLYLEKRLVMKLTSFGYLLSPLFFVITSFILIKKMKKVINGNNVMVNSMVQPIIEPGIQPINQFNQVGTYPIMVQPVNNLYNEQNDNLNSDNKNNT